VSGCHNRPSAAELVAAVAEFLESDVREFTGPNGRLADEGALNFHARVASNVLRIVERELLDATEAPDPLGFDDERALAAAIRAGELDDRAPEVLACLRAIVGHRLAVAHPGYDDD
jgi:hypothetical protein